MKKSAVLILILLVLSPLFAITDAEKTERVWFMDNIGRDQFKSVDLEKAIYLPKYNSRDWSGTADDYGDPENGTYGKVNVLGHIGCAFLDHHLRFTVTTDGRFVSQSDPTKYREFYIALMPRIRYGEKDYNCIMDYSTTPAQQVTVSDRVPNTKFTGSATVVTPSWTNSSPSVVIDGNGTTKNPTRFYCDLLIIMDELTAADQQHLAQKDDYFATVTISWTCTDPDCDYSDANVSGFQGHHACHQGSYTFVVRGYINKPPNSAKISAFVVPTFSATNLNIMDIVANKNGEEKIADFDLYAVSNQTDWVSLLYVFPSSNNSYSTNGSHFFLTKKTDANVKIPYQIVIKNLDTGQVNQTFDGTMKYVQSNTTSRLQLADYRSMIADRSAALWYSILYKGEVYINIQMEDPEHAGQYIPMTEAELNSDPNYAGLYTSTIYYHVVSSN